MAAVNLPGLSAAVDFARASTLQRRGGATSLLTIPGGPEGVLLKAVASINEAIACGGLMLYQPTSGRWLVYVGESLLSALRHGTIGRVAAFTGYGPNAASRDGSVIFTPDRGLCPTTTYWGFISGKENVLGTRRFGGGGYLSPLLKAINYFSAGEIIPVGVVCRATAGYIANRTEYASLRDLDGDIAASTRAAVGWMETTISLPDSFEAFARRVRATALSLVPGDVVQYYEETFEQALALCEFRALRPSIGASTHWRAGNLSEPMEYDRRVVQLGGPSTYAKAGYTAEMRSIAIAQADSNPVGSYSRAEPRNGAAVLYQPPFAAIAPGLAPTLYDDTDFVVKKGTKSSLMGVVGGVRVGEMRDFHTVARALDGARYADDGMPGAPLSDVVTTALTPNDPRLTGKDWTAVIGDAQDKPAFPEIGTSSSINTATPGTLVPWLEAFSDRWDRLAYQAV